MEKTKNTNVEMDVKAVDGSLVVNKKEAGKVLKEHNNKVTNGSVDAFVSLKDINKIYPNGIQAVYDFNIDIKEHDFIVLVGPSGCGKSTTLRMIAGLEDITSGYLYINKVLSNYLPSKDRDISMVFQSYALYPQMTVYDNIAFPLRVRKYRKPITSEIIRGWDQALKVLENPQSLVDATIEAKDKNLNYTTIIAYISERLGICDQASKILCSYNIKNVADLDRVVDGKSLKEKIVADGKAAKEKELAKIAEKGLTIDDRYRLLKDGVVQFHNVKLTKEEIRNKVFDAAKILDLGPYLDRRPKELSGGQMQRVALGRAIVRDAKLFLMDEPLSNLDAKLRVQMRSEIVRIHEQIGATTIYVTHDQTEAMTMATKIAVMSKGWVQQIGAPQEIYSHPKNIFVATFIGSPAMNILKGKYNNGAITLDNGYAINMPASFKKLHDEFYKNKLEDVERMIALDDFKKMHALKIIDDVLFDTDKYTTYERFDKDLKNIVEMAATKNLGNLVEPLSKFVNDNLSSLKDECSYLKLKNNVKMIEQVIEVSKTISDEHGTNAVTLLETELANAKQKLDAIGEKDLGLITKYEDVLKDTVLKLEQEDLILVGSLIDNIKKLSLANDVDRDSVKWIRSVRKEFLTFNKISSSDIGKLHNAQIFNDTVQSSSNTLYYKKRKNKQDKKKAVKVNLNSVDVRFINNLYDVALRLRDEFSVALSGEHPIKIGVRPEHIHLDEEYTGSNKTEAFEVFTEVVELMGSELLIHTPWNNSELIAKIATGTLVKPHTNVNLTMNGNKILVFDVSSGDTIQ